MAANPQPKAVLPFLPYGRQQIEADDVEAVTAVLRGDYLTTGPAVEAFEAALVRRTGARYAVAVSNGTAALHLAALAAGLSAEDVAVVPSITFTATATGPRLCGAEVRFCDVDADTGLMTAATLQAALDAVPKARAVLPVHLAGQSADMPAIAKIARQRGMAIIEDGCHALGATQASSSGDKRSVGACADSDMTVFSFHPVKTVTTGEGGAITTNDATLAASLRKLRSHGIAREAAEFENRSQGLDAQGAANPWYYEVQELGPNYRITDFQCALGLTQLNKIDRMVRRRAELKRRYDQQLCALGPFVRPLAEAQGCVPAWHLCVALIDFDRVGVSRAEIMHRLRAQGVGSQVHYIPVHRQPYYEARYGSATLTGADEYYRRTLSLPLFPAMSDADVDRVTLALAAAIGNP